MTSTGSQPTRGLLRATVKKTRHYGMLLGWKQRLHPLGSIDPIVSADQEVSCVPGHLIGLIYRDANKGRKPLRFPCIRGLRLRVNGNIESFGCRVQADTDEGAPEGQRRFITCQLLEGQQFSGYWTWSNHARYFKLVFIGNWKFLCVSEG